MVSGADDAIGAVGIGGTVTGAVVTDVVNEANPVAPTVGKTAVTAAATVAPDPLKAGTPSRHTPAPTPIKAAATAELTPAPTPGKLATAGAILSFTTKVISLIGVIATVAPKLKKLIESVKGDCENETVKKQETKKPEAKSKTPELGIGDAMKAL